MNKALKLSLMGGKKKVYPMGWWNQNGAITPSSCVAAYKGIGAASYAASKVNLANPGNHDLVASSTDMPWTTENGWETADYRWFTTDIIPTSNYCVIAYYGDYGAVATNGIFGASDGSKRFTAELTNNSFLNVANSNGSGVLGLAAPINSGVICLNGDKIYFNGALVGSFAANMWDGTTALAFLAIAINGAGKATGKLKAAAVYKSKLSAANVLAVSNAMLGLSPAIIVTSPERFQTFQRSGTTGTIAIAGTVYGVSSAVTIEASWAGAAYADIATGITGAFSGSLTSQTQGQGTLTVRIKGTTVSTTIVYVGIGDIFIIAGQSNASGRGTTTNATYTNATLKAGNFGNDYRWKELSGTYLDINYNQVDSVSADATYGGSVWTGLATSYLANNGIPIAFVQSAMGGTSITAWQPGANHQDRTTLYGSMVYRALQTGCVGVLWWQGETDAQASMAEADYNTNLDTLANAIQSDLGVKIVVAKLEGGTWATAGQMAEINNAINTAWSDNANVLTGPDLSGLTADDASGHIKTDGNIASAATLWWNAVKAAYGW